MADIHVEDQGGAGVFRSIGGFIFGFIKALLLLVLWIFIFLFGSLMLVLFGPSVYARDLFVTTVMETSAAKPLATVFLGDDKVNEILESNKLITFEQTTDTELIEVKPSGEAQSDSEEMQDIEIIDVAGSTYKGKLMIVKDPSRLFVSVTPRIGTMGERTDRAVAREDAIGGVNGGGFEDIGGMGHGGTPLGIVISKGRLVQGSLSSRYKLIGFNEDNVLVLGEFTGQEAMDAGIRDAVSFEPFYIINGEAATSLGIGGGLNPRTVIGQRKDGAVLLLVIDGRQPSSLGASYKDCVEVMVKYGAVNAANLDGGTSSVMVYDGEIINSTFALYGAREVPTSFLIRK